MNTKSGPDMHSEAGTSGVAAMDMHMKKYPPFGALCGRRGLGTVMARATSVVLQWAAVRCRNTVRGEEAVLMVSITVRDSDFAGLCAGRGF